jgi:hypothetical protein
MRNDEIILKDDVEEVGKSVVACCRQYLGICQHGRGHTKQHNILDRKASLPYKIPNVDLTIICRVVSY